MITVRFPTGFSIQYNSGHDIKQHKEGLFVVDGQGCWIARVPDSAVGESMPPCRSYFAASTESVVKPHIEQLTKEVRSLKRKVGRKGA